MVKSERDVANGSPKTGKVGRLWEWAGWFWEWILARVKSETTQAVVSVLNLLGLIAAGGGIYLAYNSLEEQRVAAAWSQIGAAKTEGAGNIGLIDALQTLTDRRRGLEGVRLPGAHLAKARLAQAHLSKADLRNANLSEADLHLAKLDGVDLSNANLRRADLRGSVFEGANLDGADLSHANLEGADLSGASARNAQLFRANLTRARLDLADFSETNLSVANLSSASLKGVRLNGADLRAADLTCATLQGTIIYRANFHRARLRDVKLVKDMIRMDRVTSPGQGCGDLAERNNPDCDETSRALGPSSTQWDSCGPPADTIGGIEFTTGPWTALP